MNSDEAIWKRHEERTGEGGDMSCPHRDTPTTEETDIQQILALTITIEIKWRMPRILNPVPCLFATSVMVATGAVINCPNQNHMCQLSTMSVPGPCTDRIQIHQDTARTSRIKALL